MNGTGVSSPVISTAPLPEDHRYHLLIGIEVDDLGIDAVAAVLQLQPDHRISCAGRSKFAVPGRPGDRAAAKPPRAGARRLPPAIIRVIAIVLIFQRERRRIEMLVLVVDGRHVGAEQACEMHAGRVEIGHLELPEFCTNSNALLRFTTAITAAA
jgi:hypothetical protein